MKVPIAYNTKAGRYIKQFPQEFVITKEQELFCKMCSKVVNSNKKHFVDSHRSTKKHAEGLRILQSVDYSPDPILKSAMMLEDKFLDLLVKAFTAADIPLYKLNCPELIELFEFIGRKLPPESTARAYLLNYFASENFKKLRELLKDEKIFLVADESEISGTRYFNILAGLIKRPNETFVLAVTHVPENVSLDNVLVTSYVNTCIEKFSIDKSKVLLFLSDAAYYMTKAIGVLQKEYLNMFHVTCLAHLVHNCAMKIKANFENVDRLIASVKALTTKNRTRSQSFENIGKPPSVIVTRWSSWLRSAMWYCKHLPAVKKIVLELEGDGILLEKARLALSNKEIDKDLVEIKDCYECLIDILDKFEDSKLDIGSSLSVLQSINFKSDPIDIKAYIEQRLKKMRLFL